MTPIGSEHASQSGTLGPTYRREAIATSRSDLYRARNMVGRFFNKIKQGRRIATRYDKLAANYLAFIQLASIRLWLHVNESTLLDHNRQCLPFISPRSRVCTETVHNARYLGQPFLWTSGMVSLSMKRFFDFLKGHSRTFERECKVKKHVVTCARLPF
jgi:hypothetical protein